VTDEGERSWVGHVGKLPVGEVVDRIPSCTRHVLAWTREEIEAGSELPELDIFRRDVRSRSLMRLSAELSTVRAAA
jgi:hypothetical protein